jgi:hypothetical protein
VRPAFSHDWTHAALISRTPQSSQPVRIAWAVVAFRGETLLTGTGAKFIPACIQRI